MRTLAHLRTFVWMSLLCAPLSATDPLWSNRYNGPANESDSGSAAVVVGDALFVAGSTIVADPGGTYSGRAFLARHDLATGVRQWTTFYGSDAYPDGSKDCTKLLAAPGGDLLVGCGSGYEHFALLRVSAEGTVLWARLRPSHGAIPSLGPIAVDPDGNAYIAGVGPGGITSVAKFDAVGTLLDEWTYPGPGGASTAMAMVVDASGFVYLAGGTGLTGSGTEASVAKLGPGGAVVWERSFGGTGGFTYNWFESMALASNWLVAAGTRNTNAPEGTAALAVALDLDGTTIWEGMHDGDFERHDAFARIQPLADGGAVAVGNTQVEPIDTDALVARFDGAGNELWSFRVPGAAGLLQTFRDVAVGPDGDIVAAGYDETANFVARYLVVRLDRDGALVDTGYYPGPLGGGSRATAVALDAAGNAYVTGDSAGSGTQLDVATVRWDNPRVVFCDGFESGDAASWIVVPPLP